MNSINDIMKSSVSSLKVTLSVLESIPEDGISSGLVYTAVNSFGISLSTYNSIISSLSQTDSVIIKDNTIFRGKDWEVAKNNLSKTIEIFERSFK